MDSEAKAQTELKDFQNIFSLDGKVAVVTGGSRGLGLHAASGFVTLSLPVTLFPGLSIEQSPPSRMLKSLHHFPQSRSMRLCLRCFECSTQQKAWCESDIGPSG